MKENPKTINITYWIKNETLSDGTIRAYYTTVNYKIYRFWSTVTFSTYGEQVIAKVEYGDLDATGMKLAIGNALQGINSVSHLTTGSNPLDPSEYYPANVALRLAISPMAISSGTDWYGFLGAWVAGNGPQKSGTLGGSAANLAYEHPHDVISLWKDVGNPMIPYNPDNTRAYRTFESYPNLDSYTLDQLKAIPKTALSNAVLMPIPILDFGVTYSVQDGDPANPQSFIAYSGRVSNTLSYLYDVLTTSNSTWYQDYTAPESNPLPNCGNIKGHVTDFLGRSIAGAQIIVGNTQYSGVTDAGGNYMIYNVPNGEYVVKASCFSFDDAQASVVVNIGYDSKLDFTLTYAAWAVTLMIIVPIVVVIVLAYFFTKYRYARKGRVRY